MPRARQAVQVATGQPYGVAGQQAAAEKAIPLPNSGATPPVPTRPAVPQSSSVQLPPGQPVQTGPTPVPLHAPTQNPAEPVTAGIDSGPGPGSEIMGITPDHQMLLAKLRGVYSQAPDEDIRGMIEQLQTRGT